MGQIQRLLITIIAASIVINAWLYVYSVNSNKCTRRIQTPEVHHQEKESPSTGYLTASLVGGLGNQMFIYAGLYGLAKQSGRTPYACDEYNISALFPNLSIPIHPLSHCVNESRLLPRGTQRLIQAHDSLHFDPQLLQKIQISKHKIVHIGYYFQNIAFFYQYFKDLLNEFSLSFYYRQKAYEYLNQQISDYGKRNPGKGGKGLQTVGVHVRRGDSVRDHPGHVDTPPSYFKKAMDYFRRKYGAHILFVVSSDDPKWCHKHLNGTDIVFTADSGEKSREEDFSIQACCNHTIMSQGTFGWWAGFLTKGEAIAFSGWVGTSKYKPWYIPEQYYPIKWKLM